MQSKNYREDAAQWLQLSEARYKGNDVNFPPLRLARSWLRAFDSAPVNLEEIASILREAEPQKDQYDLAFHAFCNDMRTIYRELQATASKQG